MTAILILLCCTAASGAGFILGAALNYQRGWGDGLEWGLKHAADPVERGEGFPLALPRPAAETEETRPDALP
jgi:hypothetical protein